MFVFVVHVFVFFFYCVNGSAAAGRWVGVDAPRVAAPGRSLVVHLRLRNDTRRPLEAEGRGRVWLSAIVVDANGSPWPSEPAAAALRYPVPTNGIATSGPLVLPAPEIPGSYVIVIGLLTMRDGKVVAVDRDVLRLPLVVA